MANTITPATFIPVMTSLNNVVLYYTLKSDGTNESNTVLYDSSVVATTLGIKDPLTSNILEVFVSGSTAATARVVLNFDATTPIVALNIPVGTNPTDKDFRPMGGLKNLAVGTTGVTGDITLTTTGLASGDSLTIILHVKPE